MSSEVKNINLQHLISLIQERDAQQINTLFENWHPADIAELFNDLSIEEQTQLIGLLNNETSAQVLLELDESDRRPILESLSAKEIADDVINEMDSDDAADLMSELSAEKKSEVFSKLDEEDEHTQNIVDLLKYDEDTAGGLMATELVRVKNDWTIMKAVREMRRQAENLDEVYSIYVVNKKNKLLGTLSLKKVLTTTTQQKVDDIYNPKVNSVLVSEDKEQVARDFQKYDLYELPVVDELNVLLGRITVDDVIDVIREEAEKDYQLASGISQDVDIEDSQWKIIKARFPWLFIGMFGGLMGSLILQSNYNAMQVFPTLIYFVPLIAATAGNVGVQSSAIVVQGLANGSLKISNFKSLGKEVSVSLICGIFLSIIIFIYNLAIHTQEPILIPVTISISLIAVIFFASLIGTIVPIILDKRGIDPAIATGPFITTSNDIFGLLIYFFIAKIILGI